MTDDPLPMRVRFDTKEDEEGWTVFDIFTGNPTEVNGVSQVGLPAEDAEDLADLLNYQESLKASKDTNGEG